MLGLRIKSGPFSTAIAPEQHRHTVGVWPVGSCGLRFTP